jgi:hypothetical protein
MKSRVNRPRVTSLIMDASLLCVMPIRDEVQHHGRSKLRVFDLNHVPKSAMRRGGFAVNIAKLPELLWQRPLSFGM